MRHVSVTQCRIRDPQRITCAALLPEPSTLLIFCERAKNAVLAGDDGSMLIDSGEIPPRPEPSEAESSTTPRVLTVLSFVLERLVARNELLGGLGEAEPMSKGLNVFHGVRAPSISIPKYLERIYKYTNCSPSCFVVGFVYIDRLVHKHPDSLVISLNVHRLLVTSVMVASKVLDDVNEMKRYLQGSHSIRPLTEAIRHYNNAFYARVGGVSNTELNRLELNLLFLLDFGVVVSSRTFESYCLHLEKEMVWSGVGQRIERFGSNSMDDETEVSLGDATKMSSPSHTIVEV